MFVFQFRQHTVNNFNFLYDFFTKSLKFTKKGFFSSSQGWIDKKNPQHLAWSGLIKKNI